ncbi:aldehyde dehydrogenase family protein [Candidatus Micrarchaeota archaeon]|nr:aldehyde dehydrogenase family protein [Candidatus Micrarchaeota archaeon]
MPEFVYSINPATERIIAKIKSTPPDGVKLAVETARKAFGKWSKAPLEKRTAALRSIAREIKHSKKKLRKQSCLKWASRLKLH